MKFITLTFIIFVTGTYSFGQGKWTAKKKEIRTDTFDIFAHSREKFFKEESSFRAEKNDVKLIYTQEYDNPCCVDDESISQLVIVLKNWNTIEINRDYDLIDMETKYEVIAFMSGEYNKPTGLIRLVKRTKKNLTFSFDVRVQSNDKGLILVYKGDREFKKSRK